MEALRILVDMRRVIVGLVILALLYCAVVFWLGALREKEWWASIIAGLLFLAILSVAVFFASFVHV